MRRREGSRIAEWQEIPISFNINTRTDWSGKVWLLQIQSPNPIYLVQENSPVHTTFIIYPSQHPNIKQTNISSCHPEERLEVTEYKVIIFWLGGLWDHCQCYPDWPRRWRWYWPEHWGWCGASYKWGHGHKFRCFWSNCIYLYLCCVLSRRSLALGLFPPLVARSGLLPSGRGLIEMTIEMDNPCFILCSTSTLHRTQ